MSIRSETKFETPAPAYRLSGQFFKATSILISGTAISQLIQFLGFPVIVRLYTPEMIAAYAVILSLVLPLTIVSTAIYEQAIMLPKTDIGASIVQRLCFLLSISVNVVAGIVVYFVRGHIDNYMNVSLDLVWLIVPVASFLLSYMRILNSYANRNKWYVAMSSARIGRVVGMLGIQIGLALAVGTGVLGLVLGDVVGALAASLLLYFAFFRKNGRDQVRIVRYRYTLHRLGVAARKFSEFPKISMPRGLMVELKATALVFFIGSTFSAAELAAYYLMLRVVGIPSMLIGQAVGHVYYREATSSRARLGRFDALTTQVVVMLLLAGAAFGLILWVAGPFLFELVFGEQWRVAGVYARSMSYLIVFQFTLAPLSPFAAIVAGRQKTAFLLAVLQEVIFVVAFVIGSNLTGTVEGALSVAAIPTAIYMAWFIYWNIQISRSERS